MRSNYTALTSRWPHEHIRFAPLVHCYRALGLQRPSLGVGSKHQL